MEMYDSHGEHIIRTECDAEVLRRGVKPGERRYRICRRRAIVMVRRVAYSTGREHRIYYCARHASRASYPAEHQGFSHLEVRPL